MNKVGLIIIYNHQFVQNIDIIESIYGDRFSHIFHLMPFYLGNKENVIPVYENSYYFQGYIAQGLKSFYSDKFAHYIFIADDLILNPKINENNYHEHLHLKENSCFLSGFISLHERKIFWYRVYEAYKFRTHVIGVEAENQLPDFNTALNLFHGHNLETKNLFFDQLFYSRPLPKPWKIYSMYRYISYKINRFFNHNRTFQLTYPLVGGYSDISVVSKRSIRLFAHYCGVFAATRLFVELALPTSMVLSTNDIITEANIELNGKAIWTEEEMKILDPFNKSLEELLTQFPENLLYIHPIKLSQWN